MYSAMTTNRRKEVMCMKVKLAQVIAALSLAGVLGFGGFSLAAAQDSTTTAPTDESTTTTEDDSTTTAPSEDDSTQDENCPLGDRADGTSEGSGTSASSYRSSTRAARAA
jgi:hypothetical protein